MPAWTCHFCEGANPADTRFCGTCASLREPDGFSKLWGCDACGAGNVADTVFCGHCGDARALEARHTDERRLVTALFADISGFTTLADQLEDAEALHGVIEPVIAGLAAVAERYDGFIAKYAGDALLVFFGAPIAHEDDPARALLVALEMHAALPLVLAGLPEQAQGLGMHIGINTGRVISGQFGGDLRSDYSILGDAVILAQRLESVAPSGTTYVGETTVQLAGDAFAFEPIGELQLKGKLKAVPVWKLIERRIVTSATTTELGPIVGRAAEVAAIDAMLGGLARGRGGGVVAVVGEPGVGKSRLIAEARSLADKRGVRWLQTRCLAYGASLPYWPFAELLRVVAGIGPAGTAAEARARLTRAPGVTARSLPFLARLIGATTEPGEVPDDSEALRSGLHEAVTDWLVSLGQEEPTVLMIEDLHWIDKASLVLCEQLTRVMHGWALALVLSARPEGRAQLAEITEHVEPSWVATFNINPLDSEAILVYLTVLLRGEPPPELVAVVEERTRGNPLFVGELTRSLLDEAALDMRNGRWRMRPGWKPGDVPETIERVLAGRIDLLAAGDARLLQTASVIGRLVRIPLLRAVMDDADIEHRLQVLVTAGFLDPSTDGLEPAYLFHHALVQNVAYDRLLRKTRRDLHRRVAEVAERLYGNGDDIVDLLARHAYLGEIPGAVSILRRAAERAKQLFANDEAIIHLEHALEVAAPNIQGELQLDVGDLRNVVGDYDGALACYDAAGAEPRAAGGRADVLRKLGDFVAALAVADQALAALAADAPERPGLLLQRGWSRLQLGDTCGACHSLREAIALAAADDPVVVAALVVLATASPEVEPAEAAQLGLFARHFAERRGDQRSVGAALRVVGDAYHDLGRIEDAMAALRAAIDVAQRTGDAQELGAGLLNLGMVELERGRLDEAIALDELAAAQFERIDHGVGVALAWGNMAEKLLEMGRVEEAEHRCLAAIEKAVTIGYAVSIADVTFTLARIRERQGRVVEAAELADESAARFTDLEEALLAERAAELAARLRSGGDGVGAGGGTAPTRI